MLRGFLGNKIDKNYQQLVKEFLQKLHNLRCNMSLKIHILHSHLDFLPKNFGAASDELDKRFHQDIAVMELRY